MRTTSQVVINTNYELQLIKASLEHYGAYIESIQLPPTHYWNDNLSEVYGQIQRLLSQIEAAENQQLGEPVGAV